MNRWCVEGRHTTHGAQMRPRHHRVKNVYGQARVATRTLESPNTNAAVQAHLYIHSQGPTVLQKMLGRAHAAASEMVIVDK